MNTVTVDSTGWVKGRIGTFIAILATLVAFAGYGINMQRDVKDVQNDVISVHADISDLKAIIKQDIQTKLTTQTEFSIRQEGVNRSMTEKLDYLVRGRQGRPPELGIPAVSQ